MLQNRKLIELSHTIEPSSPTWYGGTAFTAPLVYDYTSCTTQTKFRVQELILHAGTGTHVDAPGHCIPGGRTVEQLWLDELVAPCIVIDVTTEAKPDSLISLEAVQTFERTHKAVIAGSIVFFKTGWSCWWNDPSLYRNELNFPAIEGAAAQYLIDHGALAIGIDTLGPDRPGDHYPVHEIVLSADCYLIENVANLEQLPPTGAMAMVMPIPLAGATEAPARILGLL